MATKIICLDLDGTIIRTSKAHAASFKEAFAKARLPARSSSEIISKFGPPAELIVKSLFPKISKRKLAQVVKDKNKLLIKKYAKLAEPIPKVVDALKELKKKYKLALISNCVREEIIALLKAAKIPIRLFDAILGKGEMDHKPSADIIKNVERALKGKVEYIVGDTIYDIRTGKMAGVKTVAVLSGVHDVKKLGAEDPDIIVQSLAALPDVLFGRL